MLPSRFDSRDDDDVTSSLQQLEPTVGAETLQRLARSNSRHESNGRGQDINISRRAPLHVQVNSRHSDTLDDLVARNLEHLSDNGPRDIKSDIPSPELRQKQSSPTPPPLPKSSPPPLSPSDTLQRASSRNAVDFFIKRNPTQNPSYQYIVHKKPHYSTSTQTASPPSPEPPTRSQETQVGADSLPRRREQGAQARPSSILAHAQQVARSWTTTGSQARPDSIVAACGQR